MTEQAKMHLSNCEAYHSLSLRCSCGADGLTEAEVRAQIMARNAIQHPAVRETK